MEHKKINWRNHFFEFIVVILGILIAFQLNTCRESAQEQDLVKEHLQNIVEETEFNKNSLITNIESGDHLMSKIDSLMAYIASQRDLDTINRLSLQLLALDYTYLKKTAYNSLVETGDIRFINDFELKNEIVSIYEYYKWLEGIDASTRSSYGDMYFPYVVENMDLIDYRTQNEAVYQNKLFKNYLSVYRYSMEYRLKKQKEVFGILNTFLEENKASK